MTGPQDWQREKRSITLGGHRTSIALEPPFWRELERMAAKEKTSIASLVSAADQARPAGQGLAAALRLAVLADLRSGSR